MKKHYSVWNEQGCCYATFEATSRAAAWKQANKQGYFKRSGFHMWKNTPYGMEF